MIYLGTHKIGKVFLGTNSIGKIYLGTKLIYEKTTASRNQQVATNNNK